MGPKLVLEAVLGDLGAILAPRSQNGPNNKHFSHFFLSLLAAMLGLLGAMLGLCWGTFATNWQSECHLIQHEALGGKREPQDAQHSPT